MPARKRQAVEEPESDVDQHHESDVEEPNIQRMVMRDGSGGGACTSISKLAISGIRAFSPHREQAIEFFKPLTMIVGANGCGKTTIIECLKYVCTGTPPPGGDKGKSFVHDPKIAGLPEVKASIKLRFNDRAGTEMVVVRSLQLTQKKTQSTFKTLDGVIKSTDEHGNRNSMSHKCGELDKQVPFLMGVSKAIMDNVIFCHQEESSWPLGDPASLKKKFDDIFESSRYSKALESIRKTKLDYHNKAKEMKIDLASLDAYREQADVIQNDIDKTKSKLELNEKKDKRFKEELAAVDQELEAHQRHSQKIRDSKVNMEKKRSELSLMEARLKDKIATATPLLEDSEEEIRTRLEAMRGEEAEATTGLVEVERKKQKALHKRSEYQDKLNILNVKIGSLKSEEGREASELAGLVKLAARLSKTHSLPDLGNQEHPQFGDKVEQLGQALDGKEEDLQMALVEADSKYESEVQVLRDKVSGVQSELVQLEGRLEHDNVEFDKADEEYTKVCASLGRMTNQRSQAREMEKLKAHCESAKEELKKLKENPRLKKLDVEVRDADSLYKAASEKVTELREHIEGLSGRAAEDNKIEETILSIHDKIESVKSRADQHRSQILEHLGASLRVGDLDTLREQRSEMNGHVIKAQDALKAVSLQRAANEKLEVQVETRLEQSRTSAQEIAVEISNLEAEGRVSAQLDNLTRETWLLKKKDDEMDGTEAPTEAANQLEEYTDGSLLGLLEFLKEEKGRVEMEFGEYEGEMTYLKRLLSRAENAVNKGRSPKCACCQHVMSDTEYATFQARLGKALEADDKEEKLSLLKEWANLHDKALALQTAFRNKEDLDNRHLGFMNDIKDHEKELRTLKKDVTKRLKEEHVLEGKLGALKVIDDAVHKIYTELVEHAQSLEAWEEKRKRLESSFNPSLSSDEFPTKLSEATRMLQDIENERECHSNKAQSLRDEREKLSKKKDSADQISSMAQENFEKAAKAVKIYEELEEKKSSLTARIEELSKSKMALKASISPTQDALVEAKAACSRLTTAWKGDEVKLRQAHSEILKDVHEYHRLRDMARSFHSRQTTLQRADAEADVKKAAEGISKYNDQLQDLESRLLEIQHVQAEKELVVSKLEANLAILQLRKDKNECREELAKLEEIVKSLSSGVGTLQHTYEECEDNKQILLQERAENKGKMGAMQRQLHELEHRLKEPNYRGVTERTRKKRVELETTNMAVEDLEKYWGALDKALLRFHGQKISDINRIIRELWQRTYCGEDIDGIEIVSGEEGGSTRAARSYNYRVVMRKGNTALDMRGRCSAGQRVLACIVIRLALAETFCVSCGILTLDEPTTNLDEYNKSGLAASLADIISTRSKQRNFQLIVITHDGDFVNHMRDAFNTLGADRCFNLPEYYWRICRNQTGANGQYCSEIHRTDWDDM